MIPRLHRTPCRTCLALCLCLPLLSSCMLGPDFQRPEAKVSSQWLGQAPRAPQTMAAAEQELAQWWKIFNDPTLTSLIERAMQANLDLRMAGSRIRQARAAMGIAGANLGPTVETSTSYRRSQTARSGNSGESITTDLYMMGFDAGWEMDLFGGVRRGVEAAGADLDTAVEGRRDLLVSLSAEVASNYLTLRSLQQRLAIARQNLMAQEHSTGLTRQRFGAGFVGKLDVVQAEALVATTAGQIPLFEAQIRQTTYGLSLLLGGEPSTLLAELTPEAALPTALATVPLGVPSGLLLRRPDIRMAEAKIHAATARIGMAKADLFPKFTISGALGLQNSTFSSTFKRGSSFWSLGPTLNWPLFDMGRNRSNLELNKAVQEEELLAYEQTVLAALLEVENALIASTKEEEHRQTLILAVAANRTAVDLATSLYTAGENNFLAVLIAQRSLYAAEDNLAQSSLNVSTNLVALFKAMGGGWQPEVAPRISEKY
ncbi:MAG: efflux transporter outer membrane subunit [Proteobacteria bacterium]|nr:efflux transporter outer membrane subunit [Desulfocapsa sp.]MBU3944157.1 efflux transporter outer membrane subunit [Pseudomonadota bacterium]MCG2743129.1 efflux transporter outer membrane subunit [Desulfobacteraceae bacterium]MBU3984328.1 efflux transporter outer membrane subunit [Pseudomonadota bacterium]MBU4028758.1 efflux transporter outer membrane subunit [Pseudomonadota bacterium]